MIQDKEKSCEERLKKLDFFFLTKKKGDMQQQMPEIVSKEHQDLSFYSSVYVEEWISMTNSI